MAFILALELLAIKMRAGPSVKCEPVWPSGKALKSEGPRFDTASALPSLQKGCGLWTLSCDSVHHFLLKH